MVSKYKRDKPPREPIRENGISLYEPSSMELDENRMFAWHDGFGYQDIDSNVMVSNLLVGCLVDVEAVETRFGAWGSRIAFFVRPWDCDFG